jgi:hypothetical protein
MLLTSDLFCLLVECILYDRLRFHECRSFKVPLTSIARKAPARCMERGRSVVDSKMFHLRFTRGTIMTTFHGFGSNLICQTFATKGLFVLEIVSEMGTRRLDRYDDIYVTVKHTAMKSLFVSDNRLLIGEI